MKSEIKAEIRQKVSKTKMATISNLERELVRPKVTSPKLAIGGPSANPSLTVGHATPSPGIGPSYWTRRRDKYVDTEVKGTRRDKFSSSARRPDQGGRRSVVG